VIPEGVFSYYMGGRQRIDIPRQVPPCMTKFRPIVSQREIEYYTNSDARQRDLLSASDREA